MYIIYIIFVQFTRRAVARQDNNNNCSYDYIAGLDARRGGGGGQGDK